MGCGKSGISLEFNFKERYSLYSAFLVFWKKLVRSVALININKRRIMRSSSKLFTVSSDFKIRYSIKPACFFSFLCKSGRWYAKKNSIKSLAHTGCEDKVFSI